MNNNTVSLFNFKKLNKNLNHIFYNLKKFKRILELESKLLSITPLNYLEIQFIIEKKQKIINKLSFLDKKRIDLENILKIRSIDLKKTSLNDLWQNIQNITNDVYEENKKNNKKINSQMRLVNTLQKTLKKITPEEIFYRADGNSYKSFAKNFKSEA